MSRRGTSGALLALLLAALPGCQESAGSVSTTSGTSTSTSTGGSCTTPESLDDPVVTCGDCPAGCYALTSQLEVCPTWSAPLATDCSPDVPAADNACACEGRTCGATEQCYEELVAWDSFEVHNVCGPQPQCAANEDCPAGQVCVPPFVTPAGVSMILDDPGGICVTPECRTDADCTAAPCGACRVAIHKTSINADRYQFQGIKCVYGSPSP